MIVRDDVRRTVLMLVLASCGRSHEPPGPTTQARPSIMVYGCLSREAQACELEPGEAVLRLWIDQGSASLGVTVDGVAADHGMRAVEGGQQVRVNVPPAARELVVQGLDPAWDEPLRLTLHRTPAPVEVREARALDALGEHERALAVLEDFRPADPRDQLVTLGTRRRIEWALGRNDDALMHARAEADLARDLGRAREHGEAASTVCHHHLVRTELDQATPWCARLLAASAAAPELEAVARYYSGGAASATGDVARAEDEFRASTRLARRMGDLNLLFVVGAQWATALAELGRFERSSALVRELVELADDPEVACDERVDVLVNAAWASIRLAQSGLPYDPPHAWLDAMIADVDPGGRCPDPYQASNARINLALLHLAEDEIDLAADVVDRLRADDDPEWTDWVDELEAAVALAQGRPERLPEPTPRRHVDPVLSWFAALRHAEQLERFGSSDAAVDAYVAIEARLDRAVRSVGYDAGQERFLAGRSHSARRLVELLVANGRTDEALCRARIAAARAVHIADRRARTATLDEQQRATFTAELREYQRARTDIEAMTAQAWTMASDRQEHARAAAAERLQAADAVLDEMLGLDAAPQDCSSLRASTSERPLLVGFPGNTATFVFVGDGERLHVRRLDERDDADTYAAALEAPLESLAPTGRLTVITAGAASNVPFHALEHGQRWLGAQLAIAYGLDLVPRDAEAAGSRALVVADPSGNLQAAREEAAVVDAELRADRWTVALLEGPAATRQALLAALDVRLGLLHYAGHGERGSDAWDGALRLADHGVLRVADVLALPTTPSRVVLAGCYTGAREQSSLTGGMNLGRAFLLAGADEVLVADQAIDDAVTLALTSAMYEDGAPTDLARALRRAQGRLRARGLAGWDAFRVLEP
jgi:hypothetical protein